MTAESASKLRLVCSLVAICPPSTCTISSWAGGAQSFWAGGLRFSSASTSPTLSRTSYSLRKKWTFGLPRQRAASRRHVFEAYINWFALILQVHRTQSFNNLGEEVAIRYR